MDTYVINYSNGHAMTLNLDDGLATLLYSEFLKNSPRMHLMGVGVLDLQDVRSVIRQEPVKDDNPSYSTEMTQEEKDYIAQQEQFEQYLKEKRDSDYEDESDFDGSDI